MNSIYAPPFKEKSDNFAGLDVHAGIALFLSREAEAADSRNYVDWLRLVDENFTYRIPVPRTPDNPFAPHYDARALLIDESRWSLETQWFSRFDKKMYETSWAENPPVRFRHFVSNVRVRLVENESLLDVRSNVLLIGTRQSDAPKFISAERFDAVGVKGDSYTLVERWAVLDQSVIDFPQLRIML